jgi:hypothetical protein
MSPAAVAARLRAASDLADLDPRRRLHARTDLSAAGVARRIRAVSQLRDLCLRLGRSRN